MSRLTVGSIEGLTENSNVISVPTGHSLNVADAGGLQIGGSAVVSAGLVHISRTTIGTAVSSVTVSDVFSADYDNYFISVSGGVASGTNYLNLTLGSTSTGYYRSGSYGNFGSSTVTGFADSNSSAFLAAAVGSTSNLSMKLYVFVPYATEKTLFISESMRATSDGLHTNYKGFLDNTNSYTSFTLTTNSGTVTGGYIDVYGYAKA